MSVSQLEAAVRTVPALAAALAFHPDLRRALLGSLLGGGDVGDDPRPIADEHKRA